MKRKFLILILFGALLTTNLPASSAMAERVGNHRGCSYLVRAYEEITPTIRNAMGETINSRNCDKVAAKVAYRRLTDRKLFISAYDIQSNYAVKKSRWQSAIAYAVGCGKRNGDWGCVRATVV